MEKGIVISTDGKSVVREFEEPLYMTVGEAVGGCIEIVRPVRLPEPYRMIVNDAGLLMDLPASLTGCWLYGTDIHGARIVGDVVLMKMVWTSEGPDIGGLTDQDIGDLKKIFPVALGLEWEGRE